MSAWSGGRKSAKRRAAADLTGVAVGSSAAEKKDIDKGRSPGFL